MRIGREPASLGQFLPEMVEMPLVQAPLEERPRIDAGCGVALEKDHVAHEALSAGAQEMVKGHFHQRRARGISRDVPAQTAVLPVGVDHHRHRVPADIALDAPFHLPVAGKRRLFVGGDRIDVRRADHPGRLDALGAEPAREALQKTRRVFRALVAQRMCNHILERLQPLPLRLAVMAHLAARAGGPGPGFLHGVHGPVKCL